MFTENSTRPKPKKFRKNALEYPEIKSEIIEIEKAMVYLSGSIAPRLSGKNYEAIKNKFLENRKKR
jgi:hypothetical protein